MEREELIESLDKAKENSINLFYNMIGNIHNHHFPIGWGKISHTVDEIFNAYSNKLRTNYLVFSGCLPVFYENFLDAELAKQFWRVIDTIVRKINNVEREKKRNMPIVLSALKEYQTRLDNISTTGLGFGIITNSAVSAALFSVMDDSERQKQYERQNKAIYNSFMAKMKALDCGSLDMNLQFREYLRILDTLHSLIISLYTISENYEKHHDLYNSEDFLQKVGEQSAYYFRRFASNLFFEDEDENQTVCALECNGYLKRYIYAEKKESYWDDEKIHLVWLSTGILEEKYCRGNLNLTSREEDNYQKAVEAEQKKEYVSAALLFGKCSNYKDARSRSRKLWQEYILDRRIENNDDYFTKMGGAITKAKDCSNPGFSDCYQFTHIIGVGYYAIQLDGTLLVEKETTASPRSVIIPEIPDEYTKNVIFIWGKEIYSKKNFYYVFVIGQVNGNVCIASSYPGIVTCERKLMGIPKKIGYLEDHEQSGLLILTAEGRVHMLGTLAKKISNINELEMERDVKDFCNFSSSAFLLKKSGKVVYITLDNSESDRKSNKRVSSWNSIVRIKEGHGCNIFAFDKENNVFTSDIHKDEKVDIPFEGAIDILEEAGQRLILMVDGTIMWRKRKEPSVTDMSSHDPAECPLEKQQLFTEVISWKNVIALNKFPNAISSEGVVYHDESRWFERYKVSCKKYDQLMLTEGTFNIIEARCNARLNELNEKLDAVKNKKGLFAGIGRKKKIGELLEKIECVSFNKRNLLGPSK